MRWALSAALLLAWTGAAQAQSEPVTELLRQGVEQRVAHRDEDALAIFRRAWEQCQCSEAQAQMALAEQALGRWLAAEEHLRAAMQSHDAWITRNVAELSEAAREISAHLATIEIRGTVAGTRVTVADRAPVALYGGVASVRVVAGTTVVRAEAAGFYAATQHVTVDAGETARVELVMIPVTLSVSSSSPLAPGPRSSRPPSVAGAAALSVLGGIALVGGSVALGEQQSLLRDYNDDTRCLVGSRTRDANCGSIAHTATLAEGFAIGGFALGALSAAVSTLLWARASRHRRDTPSIALQVDVTGCALAFDSRF